MHAKLTSATMSKRPIFLNHTWKMEIEIFASVNKRKIKWFLFNFSRKYEAHNVVFSEKQTNLLGRGYRLSFQKKVFRYFTTNPKLNYVSNFFYDNANDKKIWSDLKKRIRITKICKSDSKQTSKQTTLKKFRGQDNLKFWTKIFK